MVFDALYYDGITSFSNKASLKLLDSSIKVSTEKAEFYWEIGKLNLHDSFYSKDKTVLKYGSQFPYAALEINGSDFQAFFERSYPSAKLKQSDTMHFQGWGNKAIVLIILGVLAFFVLSYFVFIPAAAELLAEKLPQEYEISMGEKMFTQLNNSLEVDSEKTALAASFFDQLHIEKNYPVKITVAHSDVTNAFAFPGGHIVVYDNMFKVMKSKDEFAALLCHEYAHVANRHVTRSLFRSLGTYLVVSLILTDVNGIMAVLLQNADNLKSMSYSRKLEQEADNAGLQFMLHAGITSEGMIDLFNHLKAEDKSGENMPEFLSTHPMLDERIKNARQQSTSTSIQHNPKLEELWQKLKN